MGIDIVIPLGNGSHWKNNELRYCLRSIEKNVKEYRNIVIVGNKPRWIDNITHIDYPDVYTDRAAYNIYNKLRIACTSNLVSDNFIYFNDDFFITKEINAFFYPYYADKTLNRKIADYMHDEDNWYNTNIVNTIGVLEDNNFSTYNYDIHCPIVINKDRFLKLMATFDWQKYDYCIKSLYANSLGIPPTIMEDVKFRGSKKKTTIERVIEDRHIFSTGDSCLTKTMKEFIKSLYPNKSKYEKDEVRRI